MISTVLGLLNDMLGILKTDVNVPTVRSKKKNLEKEY